MNPENPRYNLKLPTGYLSFTQYDMWERSKPSYRKSYYAKERFTGNMYTEFGNKVTLAMARGEEWVKFIPRFSTFEREFIIDVDGIPFKGSIDNMDLNIGAFCEQKTVMTKWTDNKVQKHKQFDFYSLAIEILDGKVQDLAYFVDVRTRLNKGTVMFNGIELDGGTGELELTGEVNVIERIVTHEQRQQAYRDIVRVGREIEEDFAAYKHLYEPTTA